MFYIGLYLETLTQTKRPRALIFNIEQTLVDICQVCSNSVHVTKMASLRGQRF